MKNTFDNKVIDAVYTKFETWDGDIKKVEHIAEVFRMGNRPFSPTITEDLIYSLYTAKCGYREKEQFVEWIFAPFRELVEWLMSSYSHLLFGRFNETTGEDFASLILSTYDKENPRNQIAARVAKVCGLYGVFGTTHSGTKYYFKANS